ncbi:MAG: FHA domain-containing protein [Planctomycetaceae bacterium]
MKCLMWEAAMRVQVRINDPDGRARTQAAVGEVIRLGRDSACEIAVDPNAFPKVSRIHAQIEPGADGFLLVHLSRSNSTLLNGMEIGTTSRLKCGDTIQLGYTGPSFQVASIELSPEANAGNVSPPIRGMRFWNSIRQNAATRPKVLAVGAGTVVGLSFLLVWPFFRGGADTKAIPYSAEEARREQEAAATRMAWNHIERIEKQVIDPFKVYNKECAAAFVRHYSVVPIEDVDPEMKAWVLGVIAAAQAVCDSEKERDAKLRELNLARDANARETAVQFGHQAAETGETTEEQVGRGLTGMVVGALGSITQSQLKESTINQQYDQQLSKLARSLKVQHEHRHQLGKALLSRYGSLSL